MPREDKELDAKGDSKTEEGKSQGKGRRETQARRRDVDNSQQDGKNEESLAFSIKADSNSTVGAGDTAGDAPGKAKRRARVDDKSDNATSDGGWMSAPASKPVIKIEDEIEEPKEPRYLLFLRICCVFLNADLHFLLFLVSKTSISKTMQMMEVKKSSSLYS